MSKAACALGLAGLGCAITIAAAPAAPLPSPSFCATNATRGLIVFSWTAVPGADGYSVFRDGLLLGTTTYASWDDASSSPGTHDYCVRATAAGFDPSDPCCSHSSDAWPPANPRNLHASDDLFGAILFSWGAVDGATQYKVSRDGVLVATSAANETTYMDRPIFVSHAYCVQAINEVGASGKICATGAALDTGAYVRLSWGTCSPQVNEQGWHGPDVYTLVISARGAPGTNLGHDTQITISPRVSDAWRFDDAGCQMDRLKLMNEGLGPDCPAMLGQNPLAITDYQIYPDGSAVMRLAVTYDELVTDPNQRYVLWKVGFDHGHSIPGADNDPATCDGADVPLTFAATSQILLDSWQHEMPPIPEPFDLPVRWTGLNGPSRTPTQPTTWGRVKGLYR
jgi:hypothetical protein